MKKLLSLLFATAIVFSLTMPVFANGASSDDTTSTAKTKKTKAKKTKKTKATQDTSKM